MSENTEAVFSVCPKKSRNSSWNVHVNCKWQDYFGLPTGKFQWNISLENNQNALKGSPNFQSEYLNENFVHPFLFSTSFRPYASFDLCYMLNTVNWGLFWKINGTVHTNPKQNFPFY